MFALVTLALVGLALASATPLLEDPNQKRRPKRNLRVFVPRHQSARFHRELQFVRAVHREVEFEILYEYPNGSFPMVIKEFGITEGLAASKAGVSAFDTDKDTIFIVYVNK